MENFDNLVAELKTRAFKITTTTSGKEQINQTQRNALKTELMNALKQDLSVGNEFVFMVKDGILVEIANDSVADNIKNADGSGAITVCIDITVKGLEYNADTETKAYAVELAEKKEKAKKKEKVKNEKIARDTAERKGDKGE